MDVTPTWSGLVRVMHEILVNGNNEDAKKSILREMIKMAEAADNWNNYIKNELK